MNKKDIHESLGRFLCGLLGKDPEDWKSLEPGPIPMRESQDVSINPLPPPSNMIYFMELKNV
jgi:hypothetical protein